MQAHPAPLILLVEDNPDDRELARAALLQSQLAHRLEVLRDGEEAAEWVAHYDPANPEQHPHLILLDLNLPKLDGVEVLRRIRQDRQLRYLPVVVLTTSRQPCDLLRAYDAGANSYVAKPVEFERFVTTLTTLCHYWLHLNQAP